jgi:hypothetical protein
MQLTSKVGGNLQGDKRFFNQNYIDSQLDGKLCINFFLFGKVIIQ